MRHVYRIAAAFAPPRLRAAGRLVLLGTALALAAGSFSAAGEGGDAAPPPGAADEEAPRDAGADIDVSGVEPENCTLCGNTGAVTCPFCRGIGTSYLAVLTCDKCGGEGGYTCDECDEEGMVPCRECRKRAIEVDGKREYHLTVVNPDWKDWNSNYGTGARRDFRKVNFDKKKKDEEPPKEPEKYILCPYCEGTGKRKCPICEGTKRAVCDKCKGEGKVKGLGPCPRCHGLKSVSCPDCARVEGLEETAGFKALRALLDAEQLEPEGYFKRLRLLAAQEKFRQKVLAARAEGREPEAPPAADGAKPADGGDTATAADRKADLAVLLEGFGASVLDLAVYERKKRELGLAPDAVREVEAKAAAGNERVKRYHELREAFRRGEMDLAEYRRRCGAL